MKKRIKGMTLVELVVAIAILGLSSTMLVVAFANVSMMNRETHQFNERMNAQIKTAENAEGDTSSVSGLKKAANEITMEVTGGPSCFDTGTSVKLTGDSLWVDVDASTGDSMVGENIDFKYYKVLDPLPQPAPTSP